MLHCSYLIEGPCQGSRDHWSSCSHTLIYWLGVFMGEACCSAGLQNRPFRVATGCPQGVSASSWGPSAGRLADQVTLGCCPACLRLLRPSSCASLVLSPASLSALGHTQLHLMSGPCTWAHGPCLKTWSSLLVAQCVGRIMSRLLSDTLCHYHPLVHKFPSAPAMF